MKLKRFDYKLPMEERRNKKIIASVLIVFLIVVVISIANTFAYFTSINEQVVVESEVGSFTIADITPPSPFVPTIQTFTDTTITIRGTTTDDVSTTITYDYYIGGIYKGTNTSRNYTYSGLTPNTTYSMYIIAKDEEGNARQSSAVSQKTNPDTTPPVAFTPTVTAYDGTTITIKGTTTDNVSTTLTYEFFIGGVSKGTNTTGTFQFTGLANNTNYSMYVIAKDAAGNVRQSTTINQKTKRQLYAWNKYTYRIQYNRTQTNRICEIPCNPWSYYVGNYTYDSTNGVFNLFEGAWDGHCQGNNPTPYFVGLVAYKDYPNNPPTTSRVVYRLTSYLGYASGGDEGVAQHSWNCVADIINEQIVNLAHQGMVTSTNISAYPRYGGVLDGYNYVALGLTWVD